MASNTETVNGGIDWVSLTLPMSEDPTELWFTKVLHVMDRIAQSGYELKHRMMQGYYGVSAGNCFAGSNGERYLVQLTGHHANDHFDVVYRTDAHVARIDVQCTVKYKEMPQDVARAAFTEASDHNLGLSPARRRKLLLITGSDGGDTCYIGSTSSDQRARIYNKEIQSEDIHFVRCWRYEIVLRNEVATALARSVPSDHTKRAHWSERFAYSWLRARGIYDHWDHSGVTMVLPINKTIPNDIERKMRWLEMQVEPTIRKLVDAGFKSELRAMLDASGLFRED